MSIERKEFGYFRGYRCELITLTNKSGLKASFTNFGAAVQSLCVPDRNGKADDILLGYDTLEEYAAGNSCHGATVGRFANRIGGARFTLNGREYHLTANENENTLHSGNFGYNKRVWSIEKCDETEGGEPSVTFGLISPDGEEHFPGKLTLSATYTLTENALVIEYRAFADADTPVNLTNHSYFNLKGEGNGDVKDHIVTINAKQYTPVNNKLIPTGILAYTAGTPFDFLSPKRVGEDMDNGRLPNGYDNNFVLGMTREMRGAASVYEPQSGRVMTVMTDKPGLQFYIGIGLNGEHGKNGHTYDQYAGLCLESQFFPDSPNKPDFPNCIVKAGEEYHCKTVYSFDVK